MATWLNAPLVNQSGTGTFEASNYLNQHKHIGLYFSANWCKPCVRFEELLPLCHKNINLRGDSFGIIIVSDDKSEAEFKLHASKNTWPALPFLDFKVKVSIYEKNQVMFHYVVQAWKVIFPKIID